MNSNNFFQLVAEFQKNIDWLNQVLKGDKNDSITIDGKVKPSITKDIADKYALLQSMIQGRPAYKTKAELIAAGHVADVAEVWQDPDSSNNGLWGWDSGWKKSDYDPMGFTYKMLDSDLFFVGFGQVDVLFEDDPTPDAKYQRAKIRLKGAFYCQNQTKTGIKQKIFDDWTEFLVPHNYNLYWDFDSDNFVVLYNNDIAPLNASLLAFVHGSQIKTGKLKPYVYIGDKTSVFVQGKISTVKNSSGDVVVNLNNCDYIYGQLLNGGTTPIYTVGSDTVFTLAHNDGLWWNINDNKLLVSPATERAPGKAILLMRIHNGEIKTNTIQNGLTDVSMDDVFWFQESSQSKQITARQTTGQNIEVDIPEGTSMWLFSKQGGKLFEWRSIPAQAFELAVNEALWWEPVNNTFKTGPHETFVGGSMCLIACNFYGVVAGAIANDLHASDLNKGKYILFPSDERGISYTSPEQNKIQVTFKSKLTLWVFGNLGRQLASKYFVSDETYTLSHNQALYVDFTKQSAFVAGHASKQSSNAVMIALCLNGYLVSGWIHAERKADRDGMDWFMDQPSQVRVSGKGGYSSNSTLVFDFKENSRMSLMDKQGRIEYDWSSISKQRIEVPHNASLLWDTTDNTFKVRPNSLRRGWSEVLLAFNHHGTIKMGRFMALVELWSAAPKERNYQRVELHESVLIGQGFTIMDNQLVVCNESTDDHIGFNGVIRFYDMGQFEYNVKTIKHNLGHLNSVDYNPANDTLLTTNGSGDLTLPPEIILIPNASEKIKAIPDGGNLDYNDSDIIKIPFHAADRVSLLATQGNACWGESNGGKHNVVYLSCNAQRMIFRVLLGLGQNDYSHDQNAPDDDLTGWGVYNNEVDNTKFNATAKIVGQYGKMYFSGVNQGMAYHNGAIYAAAGFTHIKAEVLKLIESDIPESKGGISSDEVIYTRLFKDDGTEETHLEPEGIAVWGDKLIIGYRGARTGIAIIHLTNRQSGYGETGKKIVYPFPMPYLKTPVITPTNAHIDNYVSDVSLDGFTVTNKNGEPGTFYWEVVG